MPDRRSHPPRGSQELQRLTAALRAFIARVLDLRHESNIQGTIETINKDMVFAGPNVWVLVCSIFIASIGLDTNSTAVIIGAMLISPLMGPILAVGLSVGVNDLLALHRALRHFAVMTLVALVTSSLYFALTPLGTPGAELLARTRPTILDAAIAIFGGVAGIVGVSRRDRGNVIPGVAIATALMPPLCTAGFGLANGNWPFFFGALYLYALNSIFIAIATVAVVRYLRFPFVEMLDDATRRRVRLRMTAFVVVVLIPSGWIMAGVVQEGLFRRRAADFIDQNIENLPGVTVVSQRITYADSLSTIEVVLAGDSVPPGLQQQLVSRLVSARLGNTALRLHVPESMGELTQEIRVGIIEDLYERQVAALRQREVRIAELETTLAALAGKQIPVEQLAREVTVQYPSVLNLSFGTLVQARQLAANGTQTFALDTIPLALLAWQPGASGAQRARDLRVLREWLRIRLELDTIEVISR